MTKLERDLKKQQQNLQSKLNDVNAKLENIQNEKLKKQQIKENYQVNDVPTQYEVDYKLLCEKFENAIRQFGTLNTSTKAIVDKYIDAMYHECSKVLPVDNSLVYNCPECGSKHSLYIGEYNDYYSPKYAITCTCCDFIGPETADYGEAWCEFICYLIKEGYLK